MFDEGGEKLFTAIIKDAKVYGEYGCGESTKYAANQTNAKIFAVDTSKEWADRTRSSVRGRSGVVIGHVDCGAVGDWGRPLSLEFKDRFGDYHYFPWLSREESPDVILIDGRFRVACFMACLMQATPGAKILFDDYTDRPHYHVVEQIVRPAQTSGRMALFARPSLVNRDQARQLYNAYKEVID